MNQTLIIVGIAVVAFAIVIALGFAFAGGERSQDKAVKRAQALGSSSRDASRRLRAQASQTDNRRKQIEKSLQDQDRANKARVRVRLANRLKQAGLSISVTQFYLAGAVFGVFVFFMTLVLHLYPIIGVVLGAASAVAAPMATLGFMVGQRTKKFTATFSDAMDIIVRGIKSGLPVHDCLKIIGKECAEPLSGEFRRLVENIGMGMSFEQGLEKLYEHMPTPEVRFFAIVMSIQQKTGGNLAEALGNLSAVLRSRKLMREKVKALSAEATSSAMIIGALPPGVITLISVTTPSYMAPMLTDHRGWVMLGGGAVWMSIGIFVMARMINFKF